MTHSPHTILLIEDNPGDARLIREMLAGPAGAGLTAPFRLLHAGRLADGLATLAQTAIDIVLLDLSLPDSQGLDTFLRVRATAPETPIVVLTGLGDEATALKAIQTGAQDYLVKGQVDGNVLGQAVRYAIERKRVEAALRKSEEQYRLIVETAQEGIWQIDADSRITFVNRKMADMLGYTVDEMAGASLFDFMDEEGRQISAANVERRRQGIAEQHDFKFRRKDGADLWVMISTNPLLGDDGRYLGALAMVADITERKQLFEQVQHHAADLETRVAARTAELTQREAALRAANERLATLGRLKSQFLANASHELRTPLTNIKTALYLLERGKPEKREKYMTTLNNEAALLQGLLEDLLDAASLDFGRARPTLAPMDLGLLLAKLVETRVALVAERNLRLDLAADPATPFALADAKMLRQAVKALLLDTADHEAAGGRIALHTQPFVAADRIWAALTVGGDAPAPTPEEQASRFELAQAAGSQADLPADTNLRLAVCREIIAHHGGYMAVSPRAGRSSIVTLWLSAAESANQQINESANRE